MPNQIPAQTLSYLTQVYRTLAASESFAKLSPQHQIDQLREAVARKDPALAREMSHWTPIQQSACLAALVRALAERPVAEASEL